ncbi:MAG: radical SAM family heme chaperone HemW [Clostridia bacterium]|nr:radical SAM family heme chaperone HemW [Clostridia bacterium]
MKLSGLYIHIPFCKSKCRYCDFNSYANREECIAPYFSALNSEIQAWAKKEKDRHFDTVYFGGGTPSYIETKTLCKAIDEICSKFNVEDNAEITVECNPGTISFDGFKELKSAGVNRLSIGLQSTDDRALQLLGRIHTFSDFERCFSDARRAGFDNISLDLMYGLPDMTMTDWEKTLGKTIALETEHISAYALKIEEGTAFSKMKLALPNEDLSADMYELAVTNLRNAGYTRYEVSNFAKSDREARHNQKYWECTDFLGLGAGAYSCVNGERFSNVCGIEEYMCLAQESGFAVAERAPVSFEEQMSEFVFLGLRCEKGISLSEFEDRFKKPLMSVFGEAVKKHKNMGFLVIEGDRLRFADKAFFVSNAILADFV